MAEEGEDLTMEEIFSRSMQEVHGACEVDALCPTDLYTDTPGWFFIYKKANQSERRKKINQSCATNFVSYPGPSPRGCSALKV